MSRVREYGLYAMGAAVTLATAAVVIYSGCSGDRSTFAHDEMIKRDAMEAEQADQEITAMKKQQASASSNSKASKKFARRPASKNSVYVVQIGAFRVKSNAEKLHEKLKSSGYPVTLRTLEHSKNGLLHLVRVEPTPNRSEAQAMLKTLTEKESLSGHILVLSDVN